MAFLSKKVMWTDLNLNHDLDTENDLSNHDLQLVVEQ